MQGAALHDAAPQDAPQDAPLWDATSHAAPPAHSAEMLSGWTAPGVAPLGPAGRVLHAARVPWLEGEIAAGRAVQAAGPPWGAWAGAAGLEADGVRAMLALPMSHDGAPCGFLRCDVVSAPRRFGGDEIRLLGAVADGLCALLLRRRGAQEEADGEQALRDARNRLQATFDALPDVVWELDGAGRFTGVHAAVGGDPRTPTAAVLGRALEEVLPSGLAARVRVIMAEVDAAGRSGPHRHGVDAGRLPSGRALPGVRAAAAAPRPGGAEGQSAGGQAAKAAPGPGGAKGQSAGGQAAKAAPGPGGAKGQADGGRAAAAPGPGGAGGQGAGGRGGTLWYALTGARRAPDRRGAAPGYVFLVRDVTDEMRATQQAERLSLIARRTSDLVIVTDLDDRIDWVNPAFEARTGWRLEEVRGRCPTEVLSGPDTDTAEIARLRAAKARGEASRARLLSRTRAGDSFWTDIDTHPLHDAGGRLTGFVSIETDITDRLAQEQALERLAQEATDARARLETAVEALPDAFAWFDADDRLVLCNARYRDIHPRAAHLIRPGVTFPEIARAIVASGDVASARGRVVEWLRDRIAAHREGRSGGEHQMADGRWMRVIERATPDGGRVGMRVDITELKEAERRLADIIHGAEAGTWEWHLPSGENRINARWAGMLGYTLEELGPLTIEVWRRLAHPADLARAEQRLTRVFAREIDRFEYELRMRHRAGHWVWVQSRGRVARWTADGSPELMAGVHLDISALKRAEERLEAILDAAAAGTWETDLLTGEMRINDRWAEMLGHTREALSKLPECGFRRLLHPEDCARMEAAYGPDLSGRPDRFTSELRLRHRDGHWVWVLARGRVLARDADGRPVRTAGLHLDITERKRLEAQLTAERDYLARLMETSVSGIVALDGDGRIIFANREAEAILGLSGAEMDGRHHADGAWGITGLDGGVFPPEALPPARALAEGGAVRDIRFAIAWPDGTRRKLSVNAAPIMAEGLRVRVVCAITDITGQVATEAALRSAAARAEAASQAKSQFLANMSHEIRTPLNGVLGMAQVLEEELETPRHRRMLQVIRESGEMLLGVLNDILDMSKIEAGKLTLERVAFVPADLARRIEAMHALRAAERHLMLDVVAGPGAQVARVGDPGRVEQLLHNLVGNAVKFTERGGVTVTLDAASAQDAGAPGPLEVVVRDSGIGMTREQLARVFEDFEQADGTITRRFGGTGLGMSITRRLVALMGGTIEVDSRLGAGTEVRLSLPLPAAQTGPGAAAVAAVAGPAPEALAGLRALAADDNATNRLILQAMLTRLGIAVTMVGDGRAAVEAWAPGRFDLLLLDISMPELDGLGALSAIREREAAAGCAPAPALAITANAMAHQVADYMRAGFAAHVGKPFRREDLGRALLGVLADRAGGAERG